ncbi:MAG: HEAT repeat domain-containing protein [Terriglobales bacterium]
MFEASDLVCSCFVKSLRTLDEQKLGRPGKSFTKRLVEAKVRVDDSYKDSAQLPAEVDIRVVFDEEIPITGSMPRLLSSESGLMFLKLTSNSVYEFTDRFIGVTAFASFSTPQDGTGLSKLQSALAGVLQGNNGRDQYNAMRILEGFDQLAPKTLKDVRNFRASSDPKIALSSIAVLLKFRVPGGAQALVDYLRTHEMSSTPDAILSVGGELSQVSDPEELKPLEALTSSEILSIKLGAMSGLRKIRSPGSAKTLVARLDDPNSDIRYLAVITLAEIFSKSGDYAPSMYLFDQNPDFYTNEWKTWWTGEGRNL